MTIVTHASSLGIGEESVHVAGLAGLVDLLRGYFESAKVQSVQIIVVGRKNDDEDFQATSLYRALEKTLRQEQESAGAMMAGGLPITVSIQTIEDNGTGFKQLARQLSRRSMGDGSLMARLSIDLPETIEDGMQCQLLLAAEYQLLATTVQNHTIWKELSCDLLALSSGGPMRVRQLIPYSALDASLLFGVPLRLSASTQTNDPEDFQTMQVLFCSVLRLLQERELVLLLEFPTSSKTSRGPLLGRPGQTLVLMARETHGVTPCPQTALLWGYATSRQLLKDDEELPTPQSSLDEETIGQLQGYVDTALDQIACGPYNPLVEDSSDLMKAVAMTQNASTLEDAMEVDTADK